MKTLFASGLRSSLSNSSSIWASATHESNAPLNNNQKQMNYQNQHNLNDIDRPATANSLKTSNFDSDEETALN